jgi:hypothetical protein
MNSNLPRTREVFRKAVMGLVVWQNPEFNRDGFSLFSHLFGLRKSIFEEEEV